MIRPLRQSADFERVLKTRSRASSSHFAVHHVAGGPTARPVRPAPTDPAGDGELSTGSSIGRTAVVDGSLRWPASAVWLGTVVPKRHARRAVTRTLLKRQIRSVVGEGADALTGGLWVVRLRAPFDRAQFVSAASDALRRLARDELRQVLAAACSQRR